MRVQACAWDSDTLAMEAKGVPDTVKVIAGRFERNPPQYYQMRLERVARELQTNPNKLENYDDAGVACDRLHRGDEAIAWMEKKKQRLEALTTSGQIPKDKYNEHRYRYLANIGTFYAHRWLRNGANRKNISDMQEGRDYIKAAIQLNPDAHFGREKYQLQIMEWILNSKKKVSTFEEKMPSFIDDCCVEKPKEVEKGLRGIIVLGDAWQSVDVFNALGNTLTAERNSVVAYLAKLRAMELVDEGKKSLVPGAPTGPKLKDSLDAMWTTMLSTGRRPEVAQQFRELRDEAERWHNHRIAFMQAKFKEGQHPDTHPEFWKDYQELPLPALYTGQTNRKYLYIIGVTVLLSLIGLKITHGRAARRRTT
jgi:hypothetical protein